MDNSSQIMQDTTCTARYTVKYHTITIKPNGASGSNKTYSVPHGSQWTVPSCPYSRSGYTFAGYNNGWEIGTSVTITNDCTLLCRWYIYPSVNVYYSVNTSSGDVEKRVTPLAFEDRLTITTWTREGITYYPSDGTSNGYTNLTLVNETGTSNRKEIGYQKKKAGNYATVYL